MKKRLTPEQKMELMVQAREARDAEWTAEHDELCALYESGEVEATVYFDWLDENPRPSAVIEEQTAQRKKYKRRSKKNVQAKIMVLDEEALHDVTVTSKKLEWSGEIHKGALVETRSGDIGIVMAQHDMDTMIRRPKHVKQAMEGSYVRLLVNGKEEWHPKLSVSPLTDS